MIGTCHLSVDGRYVFNARGPSPPTPPRTFSLRGIAGRDAVDDHDDHGRLEFLLSGKGTMPTVTLESPLDRHQSGDVVMDFGEVSLPRLYLAHGFGDLLLLSEYFRGEVRLGPSRCNPNILLYPSPPERGAVEANMA